MGREEREKELKNEGDGKLRGITGGNLTLKKKGGEVRGCGRRN